MSGRKCNKNFQKLEFDLLKVKGKHAAKYRLCGNVLKNIGAGSNLCSMILLTMSKKS